MKSILYEAVLTFFIHLGIMEITTRHPDLNVSFHFSREKIFSFFRAPHVIYIYKIPGYQLQITYQLLTLYSVHTICIII